MPKAKSKSKSRAVPVVQPADRKRNTISMVLTDPEHTRILAECKQISQSAGIDVTPGKYAKHALLTHRRLRAIEIKVRDMMGELQKTIDRHGAARDDLDAACIVDDLRAILETPAAGA